MLSDSNRTRVNRQTSQAQIRGDVLCVGDVLPRDSVEIPHDYDGGEGLLRTLTMLWKMSRFSFIL